MASSPLGIGESGRSTILALLGETRRDEDGTFQGGGADTVSVGGFSVQSLFAAAATGAVDTSSSFSGGGGRVGWSIWVILYVVVGKIGCNTTLDLFKTLR